MLSSKKYPSKTSRHFTHFIFLLVLASSFLFFSRCSSPLPIKTIDVPFPHLDIPFQKFTFLDEKGTSVRLPSGTLIEIPANILENKQGTDVTGEVELAFREVEESLDVFRTGITMKYDSAERKGNFETAGMFEIKVTQNNQELQIKKGKNVIVNSASQEGNSDYSFYNLDKEKGWKYQSTSRVDSNFYKKRKLDSLSKLKKDIYPFGKEYFAFNYDVLLDVYFNDDYSRIEKSYKSRRVKRKIEKYGVQRLESRIPSEIRKSTTSGRPLAFWIWKFSAPTTIPKWISTSAKVELEKTSKWTYKITITDKKKNKTWVRTIQPVLPISQMYAHTPKDWRKNFRKYIKRAENSNLEILEKINQEVEMIKLQSDFMRKAEVSGFGIYNYDRWRNENDKVVFDVNFRFDDKKSEEVVTSVWVIPTNEKSVIKWNKNGDKWDDAILLPNQKVRICAVLPNKKIAVFEESEFDKLDFDKIKSTKKHTFYLKTYPKTIETAEDLEMVLYGELIKEKDDKKEVALLVR